MWESTTDELFNLYSMLSVGGYVIVDDWAISVRVFHELHAVCR